MASKAEEALKRAIAEDDGDGSWADDLPEADDLPDDEGEVLVQFIDTLKPTKRKQP